MSVDPGGSSPEAHSWWVGQYCIGEDRGSTGLCQGPVKQESGRGFLEHYSGMPTSPRILHLKHQLPGAFFKQVGSWMVCKQPTHPCTSWAAALLENMLLWGPSGIC